MTTGWVEALAAMARAGEPAVLVTVLAVRGSAPREAGCKMVVGAAAQHGTIGGGALEFQCAAAARALLSGGGAPVLREYPLGPALGQCCGGSVSVLFERVGPPGWHIAVFGAGHVGRALVGLLATLDCRVSWIDARADAFPAAPANVAAITDPAPAGRVGALPPGTLVLVMTHDHQTDFAIVATALARDDLMGVGLIGSRTKRARFGSRLRRLGLDPAPLICPIGVPGAGGKAPAEIAIAVAAQLLQIRQIQDASARRPETAAAECGSGCATGCVRMVAAE